MTVSKKQFRMALEEIGPITIGSHHKTLLGYVIGMVVGLGQDTDEIAKNAVASLIETTDISYDDVPEVQEIASGVSQWREAITNGSILQTLKFREGDADGNLFGLSAFLDQGTIASINSLTLRESNIIPELVTIVQHLSGDDIALTNGETVDETIVLDSEEVAPIEEGVEDDI